MQKVEGRNLKNVKYNLYYADEVTKDTLTKLTWVVSNRKIILTLVLDTLDYVERGVNFRGKESIAVFF